MELRTNLSSVWQSDTLCHQQQYRLCLLRFVEEVDGWHNSVTLILAGCRNGRRACRWLATCSIANSNPGSTRFARISFLIWTASEVVGGDVSSRPDEVSYRSEAASPGWWPSDLGHPAAVGGQNDLRYAIFPETRRLVIEDRGTIFTYDTGNHQIFGVSQTQSSDRTLSFTSQSGLVKVTDLTKV